MKKTILSMLLAVMTVGLSAVFTSCSSDDDENKFDYPMSTLYGTWETTEVNGLDVTSFLFYEYRAEITFYENGKYYGRGYFGTGNGTYTAAGKTITTYVNGEKYLTYTISKLSEDGKSMEGRMYDDSGSISFNARKKR